MSTAGSRIKQEVAGDKKSGAQIVTPPEESNEEKRDTICSHYKRILAYVDIPDLPERK
jgi:hypothetical protein